MARAHQEWIVRVEAQRLEGMGRHARRIYRQGRAPDGDCYDAAAWSAPGALSEISVAWDNMPVPFPDFTRGNWQQPDTRAMR